MAIFGLQTDFMNDTLKQYFGLKDINQEKKDIFVGLGLQQEGSNVNIESFDELFFGEPLYGYSRARVVFGIPVDVTYDGAEFLRRLISDWRWLFHPHLRRLYARLRI